MTKLERQLMAALMILADEMTEGEKTKYDNVNEIRSAIDDVINLMTDYWDFLRKLETKPTAKIIPFKRKGDKDERHN